MFISAGNSGSGMNTVGDPSVCGKVMSVGSYITKDSWQKNYGSDSAFVDNLHGFSSRGPREDGGFKPSFVAPGVGDLDDAAVAAGRPRGWHVRAAAGLLDAQRHLDGVPAGCRGGGAADQRGQAGRMSRSSRISSARR